MEKKLSVAMDIGEDMLKSGAEIHRVEDSIKRIITALGAKRVDAFIVLSCIIITVFDENGESYTQTRQIKNIDTNIEKLHKLNNLSRKICSQNLTLEEIKEEYKKISNTKNYNNVLKCFSYSLVSSFFAIFFGGNLNDFITAFFVGAIIGLVGILCDRLFVNRIFVKFTTSFLASVLAYLALILEAIASVDMVMIGVVMTLIPGVGFTNAIRDLFVGDSISGLLRTIEAVLFALSIAAGYVVATWMFGGIV